MIASLAFLVSCEKPQSDEEKRAEVERQVQQRLAAEHQTDEQQRLAQKQADLDAREKALANKETSALSTATPRTVPVTRKTREVSETRSSASYGTFYRKLEPYGAWRETSDYGYVWQPREAEESRAWRPYTDGHWVYTDAGWAWVSDEPFGWATYHYGRWTRLRNIGWVWVPGEEWAPAWVSWRTSNQYVGWAPLPPEAHFDRRSGIHNWADNYYDIGPDQYSFVRENEFGSQHVRRAVIPTERNITIVNETTNVTNITYSNTTVINQGPNYDELRSRGEQPIERYRLERQSEMDGETARPIVRGEVIEMPAPVIGSVPGMNRPRTVKEMLTQAVVDTGWATITDRSAAERARAKMKSEATPPPNAPSKTFVKPETTSTTTTAAPATTTTVAPASTAAISATPASTATIAPAATASVSATATPTPVPKPVATATPVPTVAATAAPASPAATPLIQAPGKKPSPSVSATPASETTPSSSVTAPTPDRAAELEVQRKAVEQKRQAALLELQQKRAADQAAKSEAQRAKMEQMIEQSGKGKNQPVPAASASPTANAPTPPPRRVPATVPPTAPPPIVTPAPNDVTTGSTLTSPPEVKKPVVPAATPSPTAAARPTATPTPSPDSEDEKGDGKKVKHPPGKGDEAKQAPPPDQ